MRAETTGLVSKVAVDQGAIVARGRPSCRSFHRNGLELRLGVEPEDIGKVRTGMPVTLSLVL